MSPVFVDIHMYLRCSFCDNKVKKRHRAGAAISMRAARTPPNADVLSLRFCAKYSMYYSMLTRTSLSDQPPPRKAAHHF